MKMKIRTNTTFLCKKKIIPLMFYPPFYVLEKYEIIIKFMLVMLQQLLKLIVFFNYFVTLDCLETRFCETHIKLFAHCNLFVLN